jgi:hypothetical protein
MKYAIEMGSGAMIYIPSSINIGSGIQKLIGARGFRDTQTEWRSHKPTLIFFFKIRKVGFKGFKKSA